MTKKVFFTLTLFISLVGGTAFSQTLPQVSVAYVNTTELLDEMHEKAQATQQLHTLSVN